MDNPDVIALADQVLELTTQFYMLRLDEAYPGQRGAPASEERLARLEADLGAGLPADYRTFLSHYDGWSSFDGDGKLLSTSDHGTQWEREIKASWTRIWDSNDKDPFESKYLLVLAGEGLPYFIVLDPQRLNSAGEPTLVEYEYMNLDTVYETFSEYLTQRIEVMNILIEKERRGRREE